MKPFRNEFFLPKWKPLNWTVGRILLLAIAAASFIDSLFIPLSRDVDPGRSATGLLFLVLGFRAVSKIEPARSILSAAACLTILISLLNHGILRSPSLVWTPIVIGLLFFVALWGRQKKTSSADPGSNITQKDPDGNSTGILGITKK